MSMEQVYREEFKTLVDRSMLILVLKCDECGAIVARIEHPKSAKLDKTSDQFDHFKEKGHHSYTALKRLFIYMSQADKKLSEELGEHQRMKFDDFLKTLREKEGEAAVNGA